MSKSKKMVENFVVKPSTEGRAGKAYRMAFRTGVHERKRKNAKRDRRNWSMGKEAW